MKKTLTLLVAALVLLAAPAWGQAAEPPFEALPVLPRLDAPLQSGEAATRSFPQSEDVVLIDLDVFTITSKGVTAKLLTPFGWYGFSQDIAQQLDTYMNVFKDPRAAMNYVFNMDLSLLLIDSQTNLQIMFYTRVNQLSQFFITMGDEAAHQAVFDYFTQNAPGAKVEKLTVNGLPFVKTEEIGQGGVPNLVYFTYHDGVMLGFQLVPEGDTILPEHTELLQAFIEPLEIL